MKLLVSDSYYVPEQEHTLRLDSLRLEMFVKFIFLLLLGFASAQYPEWSTISWRDENNVQRSAPIQRAVGPNNNMNGAIDCTNPTESSETCDITLNITHMLTMTLYDYYPEDLKDSGGHDQKQKKSGGHRGVDGYAIKINADGSFAFRYENAVPNSTRDIKNFLWPIIADAHLKNDTLQRRSVIAVNNQVPGPTIIARKDQPLNIKVVNNLASESISIHWHGQHVSEAPWMDGVAHITQCPIVPYTEFTYSFKPDQVGTHWYHAHSGAQRTDGLFGALIIKSDDEFTGTDLINMVDTFEDRPEEHTISLIDWQHDNSIDVFSVIQSGSRFASPVNNRRSYDSIPIYDGSESAPHPFLSGLINGLGWEFTDVGDSNCDHSKNPLSFFNVTHGKTYRFRLIGAQNAYAFRFSIEDHKLRLLATDGILVKTDPEEVDFIIIHSGERYDFLLDTTGQASRNYWIVAETLETQEQLMGNMYYCTQGRRAYAILHYTDASYDPWPPNIKYDPTKRCNSSSKCYAANCPFQNFSENYTITCLNVGSFEQRYNDSYPILELDNDEESTFLNFGFGGDVTVSGSSINGRHFVFPNSPLFFEHSEESYCTYPSDEDVGQGRRCLHVYAIKDEVFRNNGTVEMVLTNLFNSSEGIRPGQAHPVHLHGHHFQVIHIGYGNCSQTNGACLHPDITCGGANDICDTNVGWSNKNWKHFEGTRRNQKPPRKDTVIVPVGGYVVIRFEANNSGWWFLHCHIEPHQLEGMSMVVREGIPQPPPDFFPKCGDFDPAAAGSSPAPPSGSSPAPPSGSSPAPPSGPSPAPPSSTTTESPVVVRLAVVLAFVILWALAVTILLLIIIFRLYCCGKKAKDSPKGT